MTAAERQTLFLLYDAPDCTAQVQVVVRDETIWMTQKAMTSFGYRVRHRDSLGKKTAKRWQRHGIDG